MKKTVLADGAPGAIGPYSPGIDSGDLVFLSGQIGLDPATGELVPGGVVPECHRAIESIKLLLAAAGLDVEDVVKTTIFLADLADFATVNRIYGEAFRPPYPARSTVQVAALPKGGRVEIEVLARRS